MSRNDREPIEQQLRDLDAAWGRMTLPAQEDRTVQHQGETRVGGTEAWVARLEVKADGLKGQVRERDRQIAEMDAALAAGGSAVLKCLARRKNATIARLREKIADRDELIETLREELEESTGWPISLRSIRLGMARVKS